MRGRVAFPNGSRSYDATRDEMPFFIGANVLAALHPAMVPEPEAGLSAFHAHLSRIRDVAAKVYERRRGGSYDLLAGDF